MNKKLLNYFNKYTLFMAFPILMVFGQNISLLYFGAIFIASNKKSFFYQTTHWIQKIVILFAIGAIISVFDPNGLENGLTRGLAVIINYIYWSITVIFLVNIAGYLNFATISKYIFIGITASIAYYYSSPYIYKIPGFINYFSPNGFAFLCICFTAPSATYLLYKYGLKHALFFIAIVLITLLLEGRRAGFVLVFISCILSISIKSLNIKYFSVGSLIALFLFLTIQLDIVEQLILSANSRVHELIYGYDDIVTEDRSLLTRKLMVEKAFLIFSDHPLTGVGLNNFSNYTVDFKGDFQGAQYVLNKIGMNETSAHNSYASLLGEGGLLLICPFLILLIFNFYNFISKFNYRNQIQNAFYWAFICSCIHMYFISALFNVNAWYLIGIVTSMSTLYFTKNSNRNISLVKEK